MGTISHVCVSICVCPLPGKARLLGLDRISRDLVQKLCPATLVTYVSLDSGGCGRNWEIWEAVNFATEQLKLFEYLQCVCCTFLYLNCCCIVAW